MENRKPILSPLNDCSSYSLIMVINKIWCCIGSYINTNDEKDNGLLIKYPIIYSEILHDDQMVYNLNKPFYSLSMISEFRFKYDIRIDLYLDDPTHVNMSKMYINAVEDILKRDHTIIAPTLDQVIKFNKIN